MLVKIDHPNAATCWKTVGVNPDGDLEISLVVETDLVVSSDVDGFDDEAFTGLVEKVVEYLGEHDEIDTAVFHALPETKNAKRA